MTSWEDDVAQSVGERAVQRDPFVSPDAPRPSGAAPDGLDRDANGAEGGQGTGCIVGGAEPIDAGNGQIERERERERKWRNSRRHLRR